MNFSYKYNLNGVEKISDCGDLSTAIDSAYSHFDTGIAVPISITGGDRLLVLDRCALLDTWRKQPEQNMALLAEQHAMAILQLKEDYERELKKLSEAFSRKLAVMSAERDRRRTAYSEELTPIGADGDGHNETNLF